MTVYKFKAPNKFARNKDMYSNIFGPASAFVFNAVGNTVQVQMNSEFFTIDLAVDQVFVNEVEWNDTAANLATTLANTVFSQHTDASATNNILQQRTVVLTDAQIKTLPTAGVELVPAPGSGKIIIPRYVKMVHNFGTSYTNLSAGRLVGIPHQSAPGTINANSWLSIDAAAAAFFINQGINFIWALNTGVTTVGGSGNGPFGNASDMNNVNIVLKATNSGGNFTGGNASNTLKVIIDYEIVTL